MPTTSNLMFKPISDLIFGSSTSLNPELLNEVVTANLILSALAVVAISIKIGAQISLKNLIIQRSHLLQIFGHLETLVQEKKSRLIDCFLKSLYSKRGYFLPIVLLDQYHALTS